MLNANYPGIEKYPGDGTLLPPRTSTYPEGTVTWSGTLAEARVQGLDVTREISLATASGRARSRVADAFVTFARERLAS